MGREAIFVILALESSLENGLKWLQLEFQMMECFIYNIIILTDF